MTLSDYLIEAVANRSSGKYDIPDDNWKSIVEWLKEKGFNEEISLRKFDKNPKCYQIGAYAPDGYPYYIAVHVGNMVFNISLNSTTSERGKVKTIKFASLISSGEWQHALLGYFAETVKEYCNRK